MRRVVLAVAVCLWVQLILPTPAQAWWGWWDELSGAGPFMGLEVEARLACFGQVAPDPTNNLLLMQRQFQFDTSEFMTHPLADADIVRRLTVLNGLLSAAVSSSVTTRQLSDIDTDVKSLRSALNRTAAAPTQSQVKLPPPNIQSVEVALNNLQRRNAENQEAVIDRLGLRGGAGVVFSACSIGRDHNRRVSINTTFRLLSSYGERKALYAGGNEIKLTMVVPAVSWRPLADLPSADVIDLSTGAGVYWFSSEAGRSGAFEAFRGLVLEPVRIDLHVPTAWAREGWSGAVLAGLSYRRGWAIFPAGFKANAWGTTSTPEQAQQIAAEWVKTSAIFWDFAPLLYYATTGKTRNQ